MSSVNRTCRLGAAPDAAPILLCLWALFGALPLQAVSVGCSVRHPDVDHVDHPAPLKPTPTLAASRAMPAIELSDATLESGIGFVHTDGSSGKYYLPEFAASGLATFDYDNDGLVDIYFLNGVPL